MTDTENTQDVQPAGDDGMNDDQRRIAKQEQRDREQEKIDADGDAVRAEQERANGEPEGSRGRNSEVSGEAGPERVDVPTGSKVAARKATGNK